MRRIVILILCALTLSCGKDRHNPVAPEKTAFTLSGKTCTVYGKGAGGIEVTLSGPVGELSTQSDSLGNYSFPELPAGKYALTVRGEGWVAAPDSIMVGIGNADVEADDFFCAKKSQVRSTCYLCGRVSLPEGETIPGLSVRYMSRDAGSPLYTAVLEKDGRFYSQVKPGKSYVLRPHLQNFDYTVSPDSAEVTTDRPIVVRTFTARRSTAPLHTISGRIVDSGGKPLKGPIQYEGGNVLYYVVSDSTGGFVLSVPDGVYTLGLFGFGYAFNPAEVRVTVKGGDVVLPDFVGVYNGPTMYTLNGRVVDRSGNGIADVRVDADIPWAVAKTDAKGVYGRADWVGCGPEPDRAAIILRPRKDGVIFTPDSTVVMIQWKAGTRSGGTITIPDFVGTDYTVYTAADYFPLRDGASWTYLHTVNSDPPAELTMRVYDTVSSAGNSYRRLSPAWLAGRTNFRIDGNTVRTDMNGADVELIRFGALPGTKWSAGKMSGGYPVAGTFLGLEAVTVPVGTYPDCLRYEVRISYGESTYEICAFWLAKGTGMVKSVRTLVNYGETRETIVDVLKSASW